MFNFSSVSSALGGARGVLGGLSLLGSAAASFLGAREEKKAASEQAKQLQRDKRASKLQSERDQQARDDDRRQSLGALRARMAAAGVDISEGSAANLLRLSERQFDQDDEAARQFDDLERKGLTSSIGAARRQRGTAGLNQWLNPGVSLLGGFARL